MQRCILSGVAALLPAVCPSFAQQFRGSISERAIDQQQAAVPGAKVHAVENETGARFQTVTHGDGTYVLTFLPPGPHTRSTEPAGFQKYLATQVRVSL